MAYDVEVKINLQKSTGKIGFGYPLIFEGKATKAVAYTECSTLAEVVNAGFANTTNVYKAASLLLAQEDAPAKIAVCASTDTTVASLPAELHHGWRQLIVTSSGAEGESTIKEIATFIEATPDRFYFTSVDDLSKLEGMSFTTFDRSACMYYDATKAIEKTEAPVCPEAALVGATSGKKAGSITYKSRILKSLVPMLLTEEEITAAHTAGCYTFVVKAGDAVTTEGKTGKGEYIDIIDAKDYVIQQITYNVQKVFNTEDKVAYDNSGIGMLEAAVVNVLQDAFNNGIIATTDEGVPDYEVEFKPRSEVSAADRAARKYVEGSFRFALLGAIHTADIYGTIEV